MISSCEYILLKPMICAIQKLVTVRTAVQVCRHL
jgi:hypothetical protein